MSLVGQNINMRVVNGGAKTCSLQSSRSAGESELEFGYPS